MPRPPKPRRTKRTGHNDASGYWIVEPAITRVQSQAILDATGLEPDDDPRDRIIWDALLPVVLSILGEYEGRVEAFDRLPSPAARVVALTEVEKAATALVEAIRGLDGRTRQFIDCDLEAVRTSVLTLRSQVGFQRVSLSGQESRGGREKRAQHTSAAELVMAFRSHVPHEHQTQDYLLDFLQACLAVVGVIIEDRRTLAKLIPASKGTSDVP